jgi:hypothetical protein
MILELASAGKVNIFCCWETLYKHTNKQASEKNKQINKYLSVRANN